MGRTLIALAVLAAACTGAAAPTTTTRPSTTTSAGVTAPTFDMTNFTVDQLSTGDPLDWESTFSQDDAQPLYLTDIADRTILFATDTDGLVAWATGDGRTWESLGNVLELDSAISSISQFDDKVWLGTDEPGPTLWSSSDGIAWTSHPIEVDHDNGFRTFTPEAVAGHEFITLAAGEPRLDPDDLLEPIVREQLWPGYEAGRYGVDLRPTDDDVQIDLLGPLNLVLLSTTASELGISDTELEWLADEEPSSDTEVWVQSSGGAWTPSTIEGADTTFSIAATAAGEFVAVGLTELEILALWRSFDGFFWEQLEYSLRPFEVSQWDGGLIGPSESGAVDLLVSTDGTVWDPLGLGTFFPPSIQWFVSSYEASDDTLTASVLGFQSFLGFASESERSLLQKDGVEITVEPFWDRLIITDAEGNRHIWSGSGSEDQGRMVFDTDAGTMTFMDEEDGPLVALTFDEIDTMIEEYNSTFNLSLFHKAIAHSPDGSNWEVWGLDHLEDRIFIGQVGEVGGNLVVVADSQEGGGFEVWTAGLP